MLQIIALLSRRCQPQIDRPCGEKYGVDFCGAFCSNPKSKKNCLHFWKIFSPLKSDKVDFPSHNCVGIANVKPGSEEWHCYWLKNSSEILSTFHPFCLFRRTFFCSQNFKTVVLFIPLNFINRTYNESSGANQR